MIGEGMYILLAFENRFARPPRSGRIGKRVQLPRCRATVSEDIASGHWSDLGRPAARVELRASVGQECPTRKG